MLLKQEQGERLLSKATKSRGKLGQRKNMTAKRVVTQPQLMFRLLLVLFLRMLRK